MDSEMSEVLDVKMGMHQGFVLSRFLFTVVVDVVIEFGIEVVLSCCMVII